MLDNSVHILRILVLGRIIFTRGNTLLAIELASLRLAASLLLVAEEALKVVTQLRIELLLILLNLIRADKWEKAVHFSVAVFLENTLLLRVLLEYFILHFEIFLHDVLVEVFTFILDFVQLSQLIQEVLLLLSLMIMAGTIVVQLLANLVQMLLHELLAGHLLAVVDLLAEFY